MAPHQDSAERTRRRAKKSEYFLKPARQGAVSVFRRPAGNRIEPKLCGTMPTKTLALALMRQLEQAESVVNDLFLEATDDGIEALEAILRACRESVERRAARQHPQHPVDARQPRGKRGRQGSASAPHPTPARPAADAAPTTGNDAPAAHPAAGAPRRRRSRPRRGKP